MPQRAPTHQPSIATPSSRPASLISEVSPCVFIGASPSPMDIRPRTPAASKPPTPVILSQAEMSTDTNFSPTASIFSLPYRTLFAVVTMDTVAIYDTQQARPVCILPNYLWWIYRFDLVRSFNQCLWTCTVSFQSEGLKKWTMSDSFLSRWLLYLDRIRWDPSRISHATTDTSTPIQSTPSFTAYLLPHELLTPFWFWLSWQPFFRSLSTRFI